MPKLVNQLDLKARKDLTDAYQVLVTDPVDYEIYRVPVPMFRGASSFVSANEPTVTPEDPLMVEYIKGDTYIHESSEGLKYYSWDDINSAWVSETRLNGLRVFSAVDFPEEINLDIRLTNFQSDTAFSNDYYLNKVSNILYQYSATNGFKFGSIDFSGYEGFRAPTTFEFQGNDVDGYLNVADYHSAVFLTLDDVSQRKMYHPIHQDSFHLKLENDEGHGGWVWYFDSTISVSDANYYVNLERKLGIDRADLVGSLGNRYHAREAKTWNENTAPVQNNKRYRQGDNVFDVVNGVLYYNYQEGAPANTTDLGVLFEGQTTLAGSSLKTAQVAGVWQDPSADDGKYKQGDYIFTQSRATPRIHGPYKFGAGTDKEAWPLFSILRQPITHVNTADTALITTFDAAVYPTDADGNMIVDGDTWEKVYVADLANANDDTKRVTLSKGVVVDYAGNTLDWGTETTNGRPPRFWRQDTVGQPVRDDNAYYEGDYIITVDGSVYGPYVEDAVDNPTAWPFFTSLTANKSVRALDQASDYIPPTDNNDASWGGGTIAEGDTLFVYYVGSNTGKYREYLAVDIDITNANAITWQEIGKAPVNHSTSAKTWPVVNDADYRTGDYIENGSGVKFGPYVEGQIVSDNKIAWPYSAVKRAPKNYYKNDFLFANVSTDTVLPSTTSAEIVDDYWGVENQNMMLVVGDVFTFISADGKVASFEVQSVDYTAGTHTRVRVAGVGTNSKIHNSNETNTPQRNDNTYSAGDFIINGNGVMYGPYVEGQGTDVLAWPLKQSLRDNIGIIADTGSVDAGKNWKFVIENGIIRIQEIV